MALALAVGGAVCREEVPAGWLREVKSIGEHGVIVAVNKAPKTSWLGRVDGEGDVAWAMRVEPFPSYLAGGPEVVMGTNDPGGATLTYRDAATGDVLAEVALPKGVHPVIGPLAEDDRDGYRTDVINAKWAVVYTRDEHRAHVVRAPGRIVAATESGLLFVDDAIARADVDTQLESRGGATVDPPDRWWALTRGSLRPIPAERVGGDDAGPAPEGLWRRSGTRLEVLADAGRRGAWAVVGAADVTEEAAARASVRVIGCGARRHLLSRRAGRWTLRQIGAEGAAGRSFAWEEGVLAASAWPAAGGGKRPCDTPRVAVEVADQDRRALSWIDLDRTVELARVPLPDPSPRWTPALQAAEAPTWSVLVTPEGVTTVDWHRGVLRTARMGLAGRLEDRLGPSETLWQVGNGEEGALTLGRLALPTLAQEPVRGAPATLEVSERSLRGGP